MRAGAAQPITTDIRMADSVFVKTMVLPVAGTIIAQHAHAFAHVSVLVRGSVRIWKGGVLCGDVAAPIGITINAEMFHSFQALEDNTIMLCVHDMQNAEEIELHAENIWPGLRG